MDRKKPDEWGSKYGCEFESYELQKIFVSNVSIADLKKNLRSLKSTLSLLDFGYLVEKKYQNRNHLVYLIESTENKIKEYEKSRRQQLRKASKDKRNP